MQYAKWTDNEKFKEKLVKYSGKEKLEVSGLPLMYDEDYLYINSHEGHNLVIGSTGSGKTQTIILPMARMAIKAQESFAVLDKKGHVYDALSGMLKDTGYQVVLLDFNEAKYGNNWNPLDLPYQLYLDGRIDASIKELESIAYYLFQEPNSVSDFWNNSATDYFVGLSLYLFLKAKKEEVSLESVYALGNYVDQDPAKFLDTIDPTSTIYYSLLGTLKTPIETRGGIVATFNNGLKRYVSRTHLANMLNKSDFDLHHIIDQKVAIFILNDKNSDYDNIIPLFVNQLINSIDSHNRKRFNILLDDFDSLLPIKDFSKLINYCRSINVCLTAIIRSFKDLENTYGKEDAEILRMCFTNIIYLLSNDYETLEEISKLCGNTTIQNQVQPLITVEELKVLKIFEAIILTIREFPIRTKLLPDFKMNWEVGSEKQDMPIRQNSEVHLFDVRKIGV